jgi:hypothetical protein
MTTKSLEGNDLEDCLLLSTTIFIRKQNGSNCRAFSKHNFLQKIFYEWKPVFENSNKKNYY